MGRKARFISPSAEDRYVLYHAIDRVNGRLHLLDRESKDQFVKIMRKHEAYTDVRVVSYVVMDNHFHLLLEVPPKKKGAPIPMSDEILLAKVKEYNCKAYYKELKQILEGFRKNGNDDAAEELKAKHTCRMRDLSCFMQGLKRQFSFWFNKTHNRTGTLWEGRFKSILVEDGFAARVMSSYINLNPIRAAMVSRPEDYRWSSYGEAMKPKDDELRALARNGLCRVMQLNQETGGRVSTENSAVAWDEKGATWYRMMLFADGEKVFVTKPKDGVGEVKRVNKGFKREEVAEVLAKGGKLSFGEALQCRMRYMGDGLVFGTQNFVNKIFEKARNRFGATRTSGARLIKEVAWKEKSENRLYTMRALRKNVVE